MGYTRGWDERRMRIGIDARLVYYQAAGIGQYTLRLLDALAHLEADEELVVLQSRRERSPYVQGRRVTIHGMWTPPHYHWEQWTLPLELLPLHIDVLHSPDFIPPFHRRCRSVITVHDLAFLIFPGLLTKESEAYYGQIYRAVRSADAIIAVSQCTKADLIRLTGADDRRIHVIYEAAGAVFRPIADPEPVLLHYHVQQPYILFVSTIEPRKNLTTLLRAYARLSKEARTGGEQPSLVVAGGRGWLYEDVFRVAQELGLSGRVHFIGRVPVEDLPALYSGATVFCLPSLYEGFGMPVLEAMACGTPVICSDVASLPEVAGDAAILVPPLAVEEWTAALHHVLTDAAARAEMRQRGLARAAQFSWETAARAALAVYRQVAQ